MAWENPANWPAIHTIVDSGSSGNTQGSTTSGQIGPLVQGAVTTNAPTYVSGQTSPLSLDTLGRARIVLSSAGGTAAGILGQTTDTNTASTAGVVAQVYGQTFNGTTWDRKRGNADAAASIVTLSAVAAATTNGADQINYNGRGVVLVIDVTVATAQTLVVKVQGKDAVSGKYFDIPGATTASISSISTVMLEVYPGVAVTANVAVSAVLPRVWRVVATTTGTSTTATVGASIIL